MTKKRRRTLLVVVGVAVLLTVVVTHRQKSSVRATSTTTIAVDVVRPTAVTLRREVEVFGSLAPKTTTELRNEIPGRVVRVNVKDWDWVIAWLVVAHGARAGMDHPFLAGFCRAMAEHCVATVRFNFFYASSGRRTPDPEPGLRAAWMEASEGVRAMVHGVPVLAGGKSLGGRIASMCVPDGMAAAGLVFLGYPLHPPGKPDRLRVEHLERITVPMLREKQVVEAAARYQRARQAVLAYQNRKGMVSPQSTAENLAGTINRLDLQRTELQTRRNSLLG